LILATGKSYTHRPYLRDGYLRGFDFGLSGKEVLRSALDLPGLRRREAAFYAGQNQGKIFIAVKMMEQ